MIRTGLHVVFALMAAFLMAAKSAAEEPIVLPSGLDVEFHEMLWNRPGQGLVYRFRFVAPEFVETDDFDMVMTDLEFLCTEFAIPRLANTGPMPNQVIVSLANQASEFGRYNPDVTQVFEAYRIQGNSCVWEMF